MMTAERIVKAKDLAAGDVVQMPTVGQVEITDATIGTTYGGTECVHVHGVTPTGALVDIDYAPNSTFRWLRLAFEQSPIIDRSAQRARLLARYRDPATPPFPGAVAITCDSCDRHILWVNPPTPDAPTYCTDCRP